MIERRTSTAYARSRQMYLRGKGIWRAVIERRAGTAVGDELVRENVALVKYVPVG